MKAIKLTQEQKEANKMARKEAREHAKELADQNAAKTQPDVKRLTITIEWKRSRTWGSNPHASAEIHYKDNKTGEYGTGFFRASGFTASGCGYDKESTVIASIFNQFMKNKLWKLSSEQIRGGHGSGDRGPAPYGIHVNEYKGVEYRSFSGGIGTNCYYSISEYIGGKFEKIASGKTFDVYQYTENN